MPIRLRTCMSIPMVGGVSCWPSFVPFVGSRPAQFGVVVGVSSLRHPRGVPVGLGPAPAGFCFLLYFSLLGLHGFTEVFCALRVGRFFSSPWSHQSLVSLRGPNLLKFISIAFGIIGLWAVVSWRWCRGGWWGFRVGGRWLGGFLLLVF